MLAWGYFYNIYIETFIVDHWCITLYHHTNLVELLLVRYRSTCLRLFVVVDFKTTLIIGYH